MKGYKFLEVSSEGRFALLTDLGISIQRRGFRT